MTPSPVEQADWLRLQVLENGWVRVRTTPWCHIDLVLMFTNVRVCETNLASPDTYERGWCYTGRNRNEAILRALAAAAAWNGSPDTEPTGWVRETSTGRRRPDGDPAREHRKP